MKPVDPRLLTHARATRGFLALTVVLGTAGAGLVLVQAGLLARVIVAAFQDGAAVADLWPELGLLAAVVAARSAISWLTEVIAHRTSAAVKSRLRSRLLAHVVRLGPAWLDNERSGELTTLATRGWTRSTATSRATCRNSSCPSPCRWRCSREWCSATGSRR